jgi:hypothetical protein
VSLLLFWGNHDL